MSKLVEFKTESGHQTFHAENVTRIILQKAFDVSNPLYEILFDSQVIFERKDEKPFTVLFYDSSNARKFYESVNSQWKVALGN